MDFVIVESPFATRKIPLRSGGVYTAEEGENILYARACLKDCLTKHQEAPYASHLLYTQEGVLDDQVPSERDLGIRAGLEIGRLAKCRIFYLDRGFSKGMLWGYKFAQEIGQQCKMRFLGPEWELVDLPTRGLSLEEIAERAKDARL